MSKKEMTTEKRLKVRLYLSLLVYTVVGYGLTLILDYIFSDIFLAPFSHSLLSITNITIIFTMDCMRNY